MIEILNTNPEFIFNNRTNQDTIASSCHSEYNPQNLRMINIAEISCAIIVGSTQTQDYSEFINIDCNKPIVTKMIKFDYIFQILVNDADNDTCSTSHSHGSSNLPFNFGETGKANASMIPKVTNSICIRGYTPVRKAADAPQENGHVPHQNDVHNANANANANADADGLNAENGNAGGNNNGGGDGGGGGGGGGDGVGGGGGGEGGRDGAIKIYRLDRDDELIEIIPTDIVANDYDSWQAFAKAIYGIWESRFGNGDGDGDGDDDGSGDGDGDGEGSGDGEGGENGEMVAEIGPSTCWPGSITFFGRDVVGAEIADLDWPEHANWEAVRTQINMVAVFGNEQE